MYRIRGRILLLQPVLAAAVAGLLLFAVVPWMTGRGLPAAIDLTAFMAVWYVLILALLVPIRRRARLNWATLMGPTPTRPVVIWSCLTAVGLVGVSIAALVVVFVPLSYVAPDFVTFWLLEDIPVLFRLSGDHWVIGNLLALVTVTVFAPLTEELLFRGLLLPAWVVRMGRGRAILLTSLAFAILHADPVGGFVFAVIVAEAFLRTGSLWVSVLIHVVNNVLGVILGVAHLVVTGHAGPVTLTGLQETWWFGAVGAAIGIPILVFTLRRIPERSRSAQ